MAIKCHANKARGLARTGTGGRDTKREERKEKRRAILRSPEKKEKHGYLASFSVIGVRFGFCLRG